MQTPLVSIIMPAYNHEAYVGPAIESVLNQTFGDFEFIIINDGSTDGTEEVIKKYTDPRIRYFTQENKDAHNTINRGLSLAQGTYISIINSDDLYLPERIAFLVEKIEELGAEFLITNTILIDGNSNVIQNEDHPALLWLNKLYDHYKKTRSLEQTLIKGNIALTTSNFFFRSHVISEVGLFQSYRYAHDYDYIFRVLISYKDKVKLFDEDKSYCYRIHSHNTINEQPLKAMRQSVEILSNYVPDLMTSIDDKAKITIYSAHVSELQIYLVDNLINKDLIIVDNQRNISENQKLLEERQKLLEAKELVIIENQKVIEQINQKLKYLEDYISNLLASLSWKITIPLRWVADKIRKLNK